MLFFQGVNDSAAMQQQLFTVRLSNLQFVYAETATYYLSVAMWHGMLLSQWLYLLRPDTRTVGIAESSRSAHRCRSTRSRGSSATAASRAPLASRRV